MTDIQISLLDQGIAIVTLDRPNSKTNLIDDAFTLEFEKAVAELKLISNLTGVIIESAKSTFVAGGDLLLLSQVNDANAQAVLNLLNRFKQSLRDIETLGKPVVACLAGSALGGGFELALACHRRIALNKKSIKIALPEVTLGLLPAAGGVSRVTRILGLEKAIGFLTEGKQHSVGEAFQSGLIHDLADAPEDLRSKAISWIEENPHPKAPWDQPSFKLPGGLPSSPKIAQLLSIAPAMIQKKTQGCYPAANAILATAVEGAALSLEAACRIENRYFLDLAKGPVAKNLIQTLFFAKNKIESRARSSGELETLETVGIVGAGMMGAGIAWSCASKGLNVVLLDSDLSRAEKGKGYSEALVAKRFAQKRLSGDSGDALLSRIQPTENYQDLSDCDLVIEAVYEDRALKADVFQQIAAVVRPTTLIASNTSTLPISSLALSTERPQNFVGLHFFSPVDKMPLLEIIRAEQTADATVQQALAFAARIGKTPIIVNDGRGFFTSRVFKLFTYEGMAMLAEGVPAAAIENAAWLAGYPVGSLAVSDEVTLTLMDRIRRQTQADFAETGEAFEAQVGDPVIDRMLELNRVGKSTGGGFYEYPEQGRKQLWSGLAEQFFAPKTQGGVSWSTKTLKDRFLYVQAVESLRALNEGIVTSNEEANVGSILGFGYPAWTGGVIRFIHQTGVEAFTQRAAELAEKFGHRFDMQGLTLPETIKQK